MSTLFRTAYRLPAPEGATAIDCKGAAFEVETVEWEVRIYEGAPQRTVVAFSADYNNTTWYWDHGMVPSWVPRPPAAWFALADEIVAQAVRS